MEITAEFLRCFARSELSASVNQRFKAGPSPFILKASCLISQLAAFDRLVGSVFDDFVDYHRYLPNSRRRQVDYNHANSTPSSSSTSSVPPTRMTEADRNQLSQEIALFIAGIATEIHDLKRSVPGPTDSLALSILSPTASAHCSEVISFLTVKLGLFTKRTQIMQKEREKLSVNPFRLICKWNDYDKHYNASATTFTSLRVTSAVSSGLIPVRSAANIAAVATLVNSLSKPVLEPLILLKRSLVVSAWNPPTRLPMLGV